MDAVKEPMAVRLLGGFSLRVDREWVTVTRPSARVVALLGLSGHRGRDDTAELLWPDAPPERSHAYLRTALWRLNAVADGAVLTVGGQLTLSPRTRVDARVLLDWATGDCAGELPVDGDDLGRELLPSWDDPWLDQYRERIRVLVPEALEQRAVRRLDEGATGLALSLALRAHQLDPLRESAVRILVAGHLRQGNRGAAARVLRRHRAVLRAELGVDAGPELLGLIDQAVGRRSPSQARHTPRQTTAQTRRQTGP